MHRRNRLPARLHTERAFQRLIQACRGGAHYTEINDLYDQWDEAKLAESTPSFPGTHNSVLSTED